MRASSAGDEPSNASGDAGSGSVVVTVADEVRAVDGHGAVDEHGVAGGLGGGPFDPERCRRLAHAVLADEEVSGELGITFIEEEDMAGLNAEHMGQEGPTDVLAFPIDAETDDAGSVGEGVPRLLGDVVICPAVARRNAPENAGAGHDGTAEDEVALLVVHGVLHILGWDHATDDQRVAMQARERHHLDRWRSAEQQSAGVTTP